MAEDSRVQAYVDFLIIHASKLSSCSPQSVEELKGILGQIPTAILKTKQAPQSSNVTTILPWKPNIDQRYPEPQQQAEFPSQRSGAGSVTQLRSHEDGHTAVDVVDEPQLRSNKDGHTAAVNARTKKRKTPREPITPEEVLARIVKSFIQLDKHRDDLHRSFDEYDLVEEDSLRLVGGTLAADKLRGTVAVLLNYRGFLGTEEKTSDWALHHGIEVSIAKKLIGVGKKLYTLVQAYKAVKEDDGIVILLIFVYRWWYNLGIPGIKDLAGLLRKHDRIPALARECWPFFNNIQQSYGIGKTNRRKCKRVDDVIAAVPELPTFLVPVVPKPPDSQPRKRKRAVIPKPQAFQPVSKDHEHQGSPVSVTADDPTSAEATLAPDTESTRSVASSATDPESQRPLSGGNAAHQRQLEFGPEDGCQVPTTLQFPGNDPIGNVTTREMPAPGFAASQEQSSPGDVSSTSQQISERISQFSNANPASDQENLELDAADVSQAHHFMSHVRSCVSSSEHCSPRAHVEPPLHAYPPGQLSLYNHKTHIFDEPNTNLASDLETNMASQLEMDFANCFNTSFANDVEVNFANELETNFANDLETNFATI